VNCVRQACPDRCKELQAWYDWQLHVGSKVISKSTYIPKHLINSIQELDAQKATIMEILSLLSVEI
jgi:hypothetical protein